MPLRVYVAGAWVAKEPVKRVQQQLRDKGIEITHDWTVVEEPPLEGRTPAQNRLYAMKDMQGIVDADAVVFVWDQPKYAYRGTFTELGIARALEKTIIFVVDPEVEARSYFATNVFYWLDGVRRVACGSEAVQILQMLRILTKK